MSIGFLSREHGTLVTLLTLEDFSMQSFVKKVVWACLLIVPFVALYVASGHKLDLINYGTSGFYFPFISGKNFLFRFLIEIAFFGWIILALKDVSYRLNIKKAPFLIAYSIFMVVLLLADLFGVDPFRSFWSNFERMEGFVGHLYLFAYFVVLSAMLRSATEYATMFKAFIVSNVVVLAFGLSQLFGGYAIHMSENRLDSTLGNSAYFAIYCLMFVFILALRWAQDNFSGKQWVYPLLIVLNLIALFYTGTRGTQIGLLVGGFVTLALIGFSEKGRVRQVAGGVILAGAILVGSVFVFKDTSFVQSSPSLARFASISPSDLTGMSRLSIWSISYEAWKERPVLGYGQENFTYIFANKFLPEKMWNLEPWYDRSHNVFFDWLVAAGALGLVSYLSLYGVALYMLWRKGNNVSLRERAILTGALVGYFIHNVFVFDNLLSYILFFFLLAYIAWKTGVRGDVTTGKVVSDDKMNALYIPVIAILFVATMYVMVYRPVRTNQLTVRGLDINRLMQTMPFAEAVQIEQAAFEKAIAMNTLGSEEAREQYYQTAVRIAQVTIPQELPVDERKRTVAAITGFIDGAKKTIVDSYDRYDDNVRMLSIYGSFYNAIGEGASAERVLTRARELAPKKQLVSFDLVRAYMLQAKNAEAYALARETFDLAPQYANAAKVYLLSSVYVNKWVEARTYVESKGLVVSFDEEILNALVSTKQIAAAVAYLNELKKTNPEYAPQVDAYIKQLAAPVK